MEKVMNVLMPHLQRVIANQFSHTRESVDDCMPHVIRCLLDEYVMGQTALSDELHHLLEAWVDSLDFTERLSINALLNPIRNQREKYRVQKSI